MKKMNFLRTVLSIAAAMLVTSGIFGQVEGGADYQPIVGATLVGGVTEIDSVTTGTVTRLYVKPDEYYHPGYTALGSWTLTNGFTWTWDLNGAGTAVGEVNTDEWIQVTWGVVGGPTKITVTEAIPAAYGGCSADTNVWVTIVDSARIAFQPDGGGFIGNTGANDTLIVCEGDPRLADDIQATITGTPNFWMLWNFEIATVDAATGLKDEYFNLAKTAIAIPPFYAVNADTTGALTPQSVAASTFDFPRPNDNLYTAIDPGAGPKKTTLYTYTINGINDRISRKSDYLANPNKWKGLWSWNDATGLNRIVIRVNPAPVTGPIYHIPNNWSN